MHVHNAVSELEECLWRKGLGEKICQVIGGVDVLDADHVLFDELADVEVSPVDVLRAVVIFRIV